MSAIDDLPPLREVIRRHGCQLAHVFFFSAPVEARDIEVLMRRAVRSGSAEPKAEVVASLLGSS